MPILTNLYKYSSAFIVLAALSILAPPANAQQGDIPPLTTDVPAARDASSVAPAETDRIVEGKPALQSFKRTAHPVSWLEGGIFRPVLRLIENAGLDKVPKKDNAAPRESGVKFGVKGLGFGSGYGPEIKPFHNNLLNRGIEFEAPVLVTFRFYQQGRARINVPILRTGSSRLGFELTGRYTSRASDNFFGLGNEAPSWNETRFRSVTRTAGAALEARMTKAWTLRGEAGYRSVGVTKPNRLLGSSLVSSTDAFAGEDIPGLTTDPGASFAYATGVLQRDTRNSANLADSGGLQRIEATLNEAQKGGDFSYWHYRADIQQFFPLADDHRKVLIVRGGIETNVEKGGGVVPFFDLPVVGSQATLRGFENRRFTDKSALTASLEYRYRIWRYFDLGLFGDAGQVAPEIRNFALDRFHVGYGLSFIVRSKGHRGIILDVAHSRETKWMVYVNANSLF